MKVKDLILSRESWRVFDLLPTGIIASIFSLVKVGLGALCALLKEFCFTLWVRSIAVVSFLLTPHPSFRSCLPGFPFDQSLSSTLMFILFIYFFFCRNVTVRVG